MNITNYGYEGLKNTSQLGNVIPKTTETSTASTTSNVSLNPGDIVAGKIVSKEGNSVQIALDEHTVIQAKLEQEAIFSKGQTVSFTVRAGSNNSLTLSPLFTNMAETNTATSALQQAGLQMNETNMLLVSSMMKEGMPINKDGIIAMSHIVEANPGANVENLVQMTRMGISITPENLEQFENYKNYEHQIQSATEEIINLVDTTVDQLISDGQTYDAADITGQLLSFVEEAYIESGENGELLGELFSKEELTNLAVDMQKAGLSEALVNQVKDGTISMKDFVSELLSQGEQVGLVKENPFEHLEGQPKEVLLMDADTTEETDSMSGKMSSGTDAFVDTKQSNSNVDADIVRQILEAAKQSKAEKLESTFGESKIASDTIAKSEGTQSELLAQGKDTKSEQVANLLTNKTFQNLLKGELAKQWKIAPDQVADKEQVDNLYKRLNEQTRDMLNTLTNIGKSETTLSQSVAQLQQNLDFMNDLNQAFTYIQLPLKMAGNEAHGDLYVYTNKKNLSKQDGNVSALLHLDMEHLGTMDVHVAMNSANHVNTHFYMQDDNALDLIASHIDELNARLEKKGYSMKCEWSMRDQMSNVMNEMIAQDKNITKISTTSFDARA